MVMIGNCILSDAVLDASFCCEIKKCKGICCIEGDAGAPLDADEVVILEEWKEKIIPYMTESGIQTIQEIGVFDYDLAGMLCTPLIYGMECAYLIMEEDIAKCAIEKAWENKQIPFQKPISCHLYPIRITDYGEFEALNYDEWAICVDAKRKGKKEQMPLYQFLKIPLIRKYGEAWYKELEENAIKLKKQI